MTKWQQKKIKLLRGITFDQFTIMVSDTSTGDKIIGCNKECQIWIKKDEREIPEFADLIGKFNNFNKKKDNQREQLILEARIKQVHDKKIELKKKEIKKRLEKQH